ncbi:uncharacterized protein LOC127749168 [Frankliniella occidentalis]|uniref:Uncharacterized protein LOC127749168 n=1 Tax=Frankliniella occidentalis TaxID=133901 RepID=A0A9C6U6W4_FRAOC|nr:uncharacterized protein LOC127749168 [Frankliniella occidentalis]
MPSACSGVLSWARTATRGAARRRAPDVAVVGADDDALAVVAVRYLGERPSPHPGRPRLPTPPHASETSSAPPAALQLPLAAASPDAQSTTSLEGAEGSSEYSGSFREDDIYAELPDDVGPPAQPSHRPSSVVILIKEVDCGASSCSTSGESPPRPPRRVRFTTTACCWAGVAPFRGSRCEVLTTLLLFMSLAVIVVCFACAADSAQQQHRFPPHPPGPPPGPPPVDEDPMFPVDEGPMFPLLPPRRCHPH